MKQIYHPYWLWEDYKAGMYNTPYEIYEVNICNCVELLCNSILFYETMQKLVNDWKYASEVNLTNKSCNRRAWLGAAACCYKLNQEEVITRFAWNRISNKQQSKANDIANRIINDYELKNHYLHKHITIAI
jgi:hypothetical protein